MNSQPFPRVLSACLATLLLAATLPAETAGQTTPAPPQVTPPQNLPAPSEFKKPDVVFVPTPQAVVDKMLELAEVKPWDIVYDLGCGDGRSVVTAAKRYGVKAVGFDIDPARITESQANVRAHKVEHLVSIQQKDIFTVDLREATVVFLYLLPDLNVRLMPQLQKLMPGSRIVSHDFGMRGAKPAQVVTITAEETGFGELDLEFGQRMHTIYKWVVPWEPEAPAPDRGKLKDLLIPD